MHPHKPHLALVAALALTLAGCPGHASQNGQDGAAQDSQQADGQAAGGHRRHRHHADGAASGAAEEASASGASEGRHHRRGGGAFQQADGAQAGKSPWWWPFGGSGTDKTASQGGRRGRRGGGKAGSTVAVKVTPAKLDVIQTVLSLGGDIQPFYETPVSSKVGGRLETLLVDEGARVKSGQLLATIDTHDYELALQQAQASLASAKAGRASAVSNLEIAKDTLQRTQAVYKEGGVSDQQMIATRAQVDAARNAVLTADAQIQQNLASVAVARTNVDYTKVRAPFDGAVSKRMADVGTMLGAMTPVFSVASTGKLKVRMPLGEAYLASVHVGSPATFAVPTYPNRKFEAKVSDISPEVDPKLRTAMVTFVIQNPKGELAPGMYARVSLPTARHDKAVVLPANAIVTDGEDSFVFEAEDNKAVRKAVKLGLRSGDSVEVTSGVAENDPVITLGQGLLQDGDRIRVADDGGASADEGP